MKRRGRRRKKEAKGQGGHFSSRLLPSWLIRCRQVFGAGIKPGEPYTLTKLIFFFIRWNVYVTFSFGNFGYVLRDFIRLIAFISIAFLFYRDFFFLCYKRQNKKSYKLSSLPSFLFHFLHSFFFRETKSNDFHQYAKTSLSEPFGKRAFHLFSCQSLLFNPFG